MKILVQIPDFVWLNFASPPGAGQEHQQIQKQRRGKFLPGFHKSLNAAGMQKLKFIWLPWQLYIQRLMNVTFSCHFSLLIVHFLKKNEYKHVD